MSKTTPFSFLLYKRTTSPLTILLLYTTFHWHATCIVSIRVALFEKSNARKLLSINYWEDHMKKLLFFLSLLMISSTALAQPSLSLGQPSYGGTGCPAGSASVAINPDKTSLSILFDEYLSEAGFNGKQMDRKSCNIAIPVHVPQGFSVSVFKTDYRGFASVPHGGYGNLNVEYFFAGQQGPRF
jgi:hypothetical protein